MKKICIVITSINEPTRAVVDFSKLNEVNVIVIGDKKSPIDYDCANVNFLNIGDQVNLNFSIIKHLPFNHYCRKMIGYLIALEEGADYIYDTDDDNIPSEDWYIPVSENVNKLIIGPKGFVNIYNYFTTRKIWPRGLPLNKINSTEQLEIVNIEESNDNIVIWQGLADKDPDVDAIYRFTIGEECVFEKKEPILLNSNVWSPFNSQNTIFRRDVVILMYLPATVSFRFTDILRSYVAVSILNCFNLKICFFSATVFQIRNFHDLYKDFDSEVVMYLNSEFIMLELAKIIDSNLSISENLLNAYRRLMEMGIVENSELELLNYWIFDCNKVLSSC